LQPIAQLSADQAQSRLNTLLAVGQPEITVADNHLLLANQKVDEIVAKFGSPLYVYSERVLRTRCKELRNFLQYEPFTPSYSCKANTNVTILKIIREEGFRADAMSPGEILLLRTAGFQPEEILYVGNNVSEAEMLYAIKAGVTVSIDSLAQLEQYGQLNPGGKVAIRINPGMGDGHHKKTITGGADSKFGVYYTDVNQIKAIIRRYNLKITGLNQHIGSNYLTGKVYLASVERLLSIAEQFDDLDFIDFGGGMGIPYCNETPRLDIAQLGAQVSAILKPWVQHYGKQITASIEPGRYLVAESGILFITVHSTKQNPGVAFVGTDGGFNVLARPMMYGSYHEILHTSHVHANDTMEVTVCGNICESGDLLGEERLLPKVTAKGDILAVLDAGAYGFSMSSNYNSRLRPAEVLLTQDGDLRLIRERDTLEGLLRQQIY